MWLRSNQYEQDYVQIRNRIFYMAFVYRNSKQRNDEGRKLTPGPGTYQHANPQKIKNSTVGFSNACRREIWKKSETPGPGEYKSEAGGLKGSVDMAAQKFGVLIEHSLTQPSSVFKSKSKRLFEGHPTTPGPGEYHLQDGERQFYYKRPVMSAKSTKLAQYLYEQNKVKITKMNDREGFNHEHIGQQHAAQKSASRKTNNKNSRTSSFASGVKRDKNSRPQTTKAVGPGSYQIAQSFDFIDRKPIHIDQKDSNPKNLLMGEIDQKFIKQHENLGPGCYDPKDTGFIRNNPSSSKGIACFGSKQSRFGRKYLEAKRAVTPGPQSYTIKQRNNYQNSNLPKKKVPFNSGSHKSLQYSATTTSGNLANLSPGSYNPIKEFGDLLKKSFLKGTIGSFGSTVQRFRKQARFSQRLQFEQKKDKGLEICHPQVSKQKKSQKYCRQKIRNTLEKRIVIRLSEDDERPLCYDNGHLTIAKKYEQKVQKNVPFMTGAGRFEPDGQNLEKEILDSLKNMEDINMKVKGQSSTKAEQKKQILKTGSAMSKFRNMATQNHSNKSLKKHEGRQIASNKENYDVGPQSYNPVKVQKGKSFNILFNKG